MEKKKKTSVETINPYCFQICGLTSFAVASHSRPARSLERGHQISIAAPDRLGRFCLPTQSVCLSFISPPFRTQPAQIPHTGTPESSYPEAEPTVQLFEGDERLPASRISQWHLSLGRFHPAVGQQTAPSRFSYLEFCNI